MKPLVLVGASNILSDLVDAAVEAGRPVSRLVIDEPPGNHPRDLPLEERIDQWRQAGVDLETCSLDQFVPDADEELLMGPTTPLRHRLAARLELAHPQLRWATLVHPAARVSRMARMGPGCFVGAGSIVGPGVRLGSHVFVNRAASIGHDTTIGDYSRIQPGATLGGLIRVGRGVTVGLSASVIERLAIGDEVFVAAGAVVLDDVEPCCLVAGVPAQVKKRLDPTFED